MIETVKLTGGCTNGTAVQTVLMLSDYNKELVSMRYGKDGWIVQYRRNPRSIDRPKRRKTTNMLDKDYVLEL